MTADQPDEVAISLLDLDIPETHFLLGYLEACRNRLTKEEQIKAQYREDLRDLSMGKQIRKRHAKHEFFTTNDVFDYYRTHDLDKKKRSELEHFSKMTDGYVFVNVEKIIERVQTHEKWKDQSLNRIVLEMNYAAKRLAIRGYLVFFPGTPRFNSNSVAINIGKIKSSIQKLNEIVGPARIVPDVEDKPHVEGDVPFDGDDDYSDLDNQIFELQEWRDQETHNKGRVITYTSDLNQEELKIIECAGLNGGRVTIPSVINHIKDNTRWVNYAPRTLYIRLYRAARSLSDYGIITLKKDGINNISLKIDMESEVRVEKDGLLWITIDQEKVNNLIKNDTEKLRNDHTEKDLIKGYCKIPTLEKTPEKQASQRRNKYAMPKNVNGERKAAIRFLMGVQMLDYKEHKRDRELKRKAKGEYHDAKIINDLFRSYHEGTLNKIITLMNRITGETIGSDYSTRFNDWNKNRENLKKYEYAHNKSFYEHSKAIFLTLTTDPSRFPNLWHAVKHMGEAWNHFAQSLTNKIGKRKDRCEYLKAVEFTKTGLIHLHVLIFDRTYLFDPDKDVEQQIISNLWDKCGQGKIVKAYGLEAIPNPKGKGFIWWWAGKQPEDSKGLSGGDYLKKYLRKCLMAARDEDAAPTLSLYWAFGNRFFTCSRVLMEGYNTKKELQEKDHRKQPLFMLDRIGYGISLDDALNMGMIDHVVYRRWTPREYEGPPDAMDVII